MAFRNLIKKISSLIFQQRRCNIVFDYFIQRVAWLSPYILRLRLAAVFYCLNKKQITEAIKIASYVKLKTTQLSELSLLATVYDLSGNYQRAKEINQYIQQERCLKATKRQLVKLNQRVFHKSFYHIGHTALIEIFIKGEILNIIPKKNNIILGVEKNYANLTLRNYWSRYCKIIDHPESVDILQNKLSLIEENLLSIRCQDGRELDLYEFGMLVQCEWEKIPRPSLLNLSMQHLQEGYQFLYSRGMPKDAWFCTLHVRDTEDGLRDVRNADVRSYGLAITEVGRRGGWVVILGDTKIAATNSKHQQVITLDPSLSIKKRDWLNIFLLAEGRFLLGTGSGPGAIPISFGKPVAYSNWGPLMSRHWGQHNLLLPKQYWLRTEQRFLTMGERMSEVYGRIESKQMLKSLGIDVVDNEAEDIRELVVEMLNSIDQTAPHCLENQLFMNYSIKNRVYPSRLSQTFIKRYRSSFYMLP